MTVAGALTLAPQTNSVTINGVGARGYSDGTFATTNSVSLTDGNNTFTTSLRNSSGQTLAKTNTFNLPVTVNSQYDYDGNMTNDGLHTFEYDDADRLTAVTLSNAWRATFKYGGLWRRRLKFEYAWNGSGWVQTNVIAYVYDRMLPIQERCGTNNHVHVTYTRALDLSAGQAGLRGSFQGAGGIGGLLARTDTNANSALYFADGAGNITTLINSNGVKQASYLYDPFGNLLSMSGPLAAANHYRFSTKEVDPLSSDYYFGFRFYSPNLQRWRNADLIGLWGGLNVHRFVLNDPLRYIDPYGLDLRFVGASGLLTPGPLGYLSGDTTLENIAASGYNTIPEAGNLLNAAGQGILDLAGGLSDAIGWLGDKIFGPGGGEFVQTGVPELGALGALGDMTRGLKELEALEDAAKLACPAAKTGTTLADDLAVAAQRAAQGLGPGQGPVYGTLVHAAFKTEVDALGLPGLPNIFTERSFLNGLEVGYGTPGSVRLDVVNGPLNAPISIFDLKTGGAILTPGRIQQIQAHVPGGASVPIIEVRP